MHPSFLHFCSGILTFFRVFDQNCNWRKSHGHIGFDEGNFSTNPLDVCAHFNGSVIVTDTERVQVFDPSLSDSHGFKYLGRCDTHSATRPRGVAVCPDGNILVTDGESNEIHIFDSLGVRLRGIPSLPCKISGIAIDYRNGIEPYWIVVREDDGTPRARILNHQGQELSKTSTQQYSKRTNGDQNPLSSRYVVPFFCWFMPKIVCRDHM